MMLKLRRKRPSIRLKLPLKLERLLKLNTNLLLSTPKKQMPLPTKLKA